MIADKVKTILAQIPSRIEVVAATKKRTTKEVLEAVDAGIGLLGENYVQEAEKKITAINRKVSWHLIGHLQKNKVKKAVRIFDMIETLDSCELARLIDIECCKIDKIMPVLIEVNASGEYQKSGIGAADLEVLVADVRGLTNIKLMGLMTMGPLSAGSQQLRECFGGTKELFDKIGSLYGGKLDWRYLSMGMSADYRIAIEQGANIIRLGTVIFGQMRA